MVAGGLGQGLLAPGECAEHVRQVVKSTIPRKKAVKPAKMLAMQGDVIRGLVAQGWPPLLLLTPKKVPYLYVHAVDCGSPAGRVCSGGHWRHLPGCFAAVAATRAVGGGLDPKPNAEMVPL